MSKKDIKIHCKYDELVPVNKLKPHPKNPNEHDQEQIDRIVKIFKYQGIRKPCVVSNQSGFMTTWHGRLLAAKALGMEKIPVVYQDYKNEEQEYADLVADNSIASWANINLSAVNFEVPSLGPDFDLDMLGIKDFILEPADKYEDKDADAVPEQRTTDIKLGDVFMLGNHKIMCADSTVKENVERLMSYYQCDCGEVHD